MFQPVHAEVPSRHRRWKVASWSGVASEAPLLEGDAVWCLRQPQPVCDLIVRRAWSEVLMVYGCCSQEVCSELAMHPCFGYPGQKWFTTALGIKKKADHPQDHLPVSALQTPTLHPDRLDEIKAYIRASVGQPGQSASLRMQAAQCVQSLETWATTLRDAQHRGEGKKHSRYTVKQLLHAFLSSSMMRNASHLRQVFQHVCETIWPGLFKEVLEAKLGPSASTVRRAQTLVDMAVILHSQALNRCDPSSLIPPVYRWGWSDASSIKGRDWFISKHIACARSALVPCFLAATALARDSDMRAQSVVGTGGSQAALATDPSAGILSEDERNQLAGWLRKSLTVQVHVPTSVGLGAANLTHKAQCLLHTIALECNCMHDLQMYLQGCVSWTSDLGVESALSQVHLLAAELLPSWWRWQQDMRSDGEPEEEDPEEGAQPQDCSKHVMMSQANPRMQAVNHMKTALSLK